MTDDIDEALDWQGQEIDCAACAHRPLTSEGLCRLKHACVHDRYARRIDRFFNWNPDLANSYVAHPHFEVRAIAAKQASAFLLPPLLDDPEETVRWNAARRLPKRLILRLRTDPHREVRIRIASILEDVELIPMMADADYYVRLVIAQRVAPPLLARMIGDPEPEVRRVVARRIPVDWLLRIADDADAAVRLEIAQRMSPGLLARLRHDPDWRVRYEVARQIDISDIAELADDSDALVQNMARSRGAVEHMEGSRS
ncbi:MAG TPA: 4Fe4S-binding leucine-rich repeat protein [Ancylobacter sp.]